MIVTPFRRRLAAAVVVGWLVYRLLEEEHDDAWSRAYRYWRRSTPEPCAGCAEHPSVVGLPTFEGRRDG